MGGYRRREASAVIEVAHINSTKLSEAGQVTRLVISNYVKSGYLRVLR